MGISIALFITGLLAGILGALLGMGGGIFLVPALTLGFHLPIRVAVGTGLVGVITTSAGVAAMSARGRGADVALALRLEVATIAGAIAGGWLAGRISAQALSLLFAGVVFLAAAYILYKARYQARGGVPERLFSQDFHVRHWPVGLAVSSLAGMISGLLGVGGGFIKVPVMYAVMEVPLGVATATSNFMVGITAAASVFVYYGRGDIHPLVVIPTALGVFVGAMLGVYVLQRLRVVWLRAALVGLLLIIGVQMMLHGLRQ
ncbi:MAG: sulfite exporter TauE/SafE family protein [Acidobacteria bacterium]|nr:sulfite exporter TauE/SafE family protein [Acidobacteriota bacterium]